MLITWLSYKHYKNIDSLYSAVAGSIIAAISLIEFAGNSPCLACSRTISSLGAIVLPVFSGESIFDQHSGFLYCQFTRQKCTGKCPERMCQKWKDKMPRLE